MIEDIKDNKVYEDTIGHASGEATKTHTKLEQVKTVKTALTELAASTMLTASSSPAQKQPQTEASSKDKSVNDNSKANKTRVIRNFTYELHDVDDIFTSKISFFLIVFLNRIKQTT